MKLRSHLLLLSMATAAPAVALAIVIAVVVVKQERDSVRDAAGERVIAVLSAIDAEVRGSIATLRALAASRQLESGNLNAFHAEASRILATHPDWLTYTLARPDGARISDGNNAPGSEPGPVVDRDSFEAALAGDDPVIGRVVVGPGGRNQGIPLRVVVRDRDGKPKYVVSVVLRPDSFADVLREQRLPESWVIALVDRNRRFVARIPPLPPGSPVSETFRAAINRSPSGWFAGSTIEGTRTYTPYVTSELSGWVMGIAIPAATVDAAASRTVIGMGAGVAGALALALLLGWYMARRIAAPVMTLAAAAEAMGQGKDVRVPDPIRIDEIAQLHDALRTAAAAVRERSDLQEREKAALQVADRSKDEFLAMLSHELRNPLAALTAAAHVVKLAQPGSEAAVKARAVIERQTKHMARLIGDLLDISRVAMG